MLVEAVKPTVGYYGLQKHVAKYGYRKRVNINNMCKNL